MGGPHVCQGPQPRENHQTILLEALEGREQRGHVAAEQVDVLTFVQVLSARLLLALSEECSPGARNDREAHLLRRARLVLRQRQVALHRHQTNVLVGEPW